MSKKGKELFDVTKLTPIPAHMTATLLGNNPPATNRPPLPAAHLPAAYAAPPPAYVNLPPLPAGPLPTTNRPTGLPARLPATPGPLPTLPTTRGTGPLPTTKGAYLPPPLPGTI